MARFEKRISLDAATERVFQYISAAPTLNAEWPGLIEVRDVHRLINGVSYANWIYRVTGVDQADRLNIQLDFEADRSLALKQRHDLQLAMTWDYQPDRLAGPHVALDGDHTYWSAC